MSSVVRLSSDATSDAALATARRVLEKEADAVRLLSESLGPSFAQAVDLIGSAKGRVIVSGIGKSGHVGKKIAATMASTGTPAFFVHPAEASHGDMGMIVKGDVVLAISNSGEVRELYDIINFTRRFAIPLIGITSRPESTLAQRADLALLIPAAPEACPNGLAPTTSTTLTMALGDALAIALLERKGFTPEHYKDIHPGGKLGQQLMIVSDIMQTGEKIPVLKASAPMTDAVRIMTEKAQGCILLLDDAGKFTGLVTDGDLRRNLFNDKQQGAVPAWISGSRSRRWKKSMEVGEIMNRTPLTVQPSTLVAEAVAVMGDMKNSGARALQLPVVNADGTLAGLLHIHDCLRAGFA
jgi:arabinose-5-phosphate isomerase